MRTGSSERDRQVDEIIAAYLEAVAAGAAPDRQELLAKHPELAGELTAFFADHDAVRELARPGPAGKPAVGEQTVAHEGPAPTGEGEATLAPGEQRPAATPLGTVRYFGDYELLEELARGGMGVVYKARQVKLNRIVAVKMILAGQLASPAAVQRFYAEAEAAAGLDHPNIVAIHQVGEHEGQHYFSMDYVDGKSLAAIVRERPLAPMQAARYVNIIAAAIQHAHDKGILHRDLKPSNVLIDRADQPRVTDFGLAKRHEGGEVARSERSEGRDPDGQHARRFAQGVPPKADLTATGQVLGTPGYMPPEQARGERVGPWADVYSLGAILYELLTGRAPFVAGNMLDTLAKVLNEEPVSPRRLQPGVPRDLETICLKCLQKEPAARYASAEALAEDLRRCQAGEPIVARPVGRVERAVKWARRHPARATAALLVVALLAVIGVGAAFASLWVDADSARTLAVDAQKQGAVARQEAENAKIKLEQVNKQLEAAKDQLARYLYLDRIALAWSAFANGDVGRARDVMAGCEEKQRGWEWHHLNLKIPQELGTLAGHKSFVRWVSFSPDGRTLASASADNTVKLWDVAAAKELATLAGHKDQVGHVSFSPDGRTLASASADNTVKLWDVAAGKELATLAGHKDFVSHVSFSPDGRTLASASYDNTVKLWDVPGGKELATLAGHKDRVNHVSFSPDGRTLASASQDNTVKLWDVVGAKELATLAGHTGAVWHVSFSPDGRTLASASSDKTVKLWDVAAGKELATLGGHKSTVWHVSFSPDGRTLASASQDYTVKLWYSKVDADVWEKRKLMMQERQATEAYQSGQWFAAAFHLRQLLQQRPNDPELQSRLDRALAELKKQQETNGK